MSLTASTIISRINRKIHNSKQKIGGDQEVLNIMNEASRTLQAEVDFPSARKKSAPFLAFTDVDEYALPSDIAYDKIIKLIFENEQYESGSVFSFKNSSQFPNSAVGSSDSLGSLANVGQTVESAAVNFQNGSPFLQLKISGELSSALLDNCDSITANGTWAAGSDGASLRLDTQRYKKEAGALAFDSGGALTTITLTNSTLTAVDLTDYENMSKVLVWVHFPSTVPSSVALKWGSDSSNYWSKSVTTQQNGLTFIPGWTLIGFDWETATKTLTPAVSAIDYLQLTITNSSAVAQTGYRVNEIICRLGKEVAMEYYSKYLLTTTAGVAQEEFSATSDITLLKEKEVDLLITKAAQIAMEELRESRDAQVKEVQSKEQIAKIKQSYPSEAQKKTFTYYNL